MHGPIRLVFYTPVYMARVGGLEVWRLGCLILLVLCQLVAPELRRLKEEYVFKSISTQAHLSHPS
jgi:hypothetical protein